MKKLFLILFTVFGLGAFAQTEQNNLSSQLASDTDFIRICNLVDYLENIPNKEAFLANFDKSKLAEFGYSYLAPITGYTEKQLNDIQGEMTPLIRNIRTRYPQILTMGQVELQNTMIQSSYIVTDREGLAGKKCAECKREGRAQLAAGIFLGGATGSAGGFFGTWIGAVTGFWAAGEVVVSCLKNCVN